MKKFRKQLVEPVHLPDDPAGAFQLFVIDGIFLNGLGHDFDSGERVSNFMGDGGGYLGNGGQPVHLFHFLAHIAQFSRIVYGNDEPDLPATGVLLDEVA